MWWQKHPRLRWDVEVHVLVILYRLLPFDFVLLDEDSSRESPDGQDDVDASRSNTADNDQSKSTSPSLSLTTGQKDGSWTTNDRLKPAFWMTDYKQPKRCKKGNCTFQTVSKVSYISSWREYLSASVCVSLDYLSTVRQFCLLSSLVSNLASSFI